MHEEREDETRWLTAPEKRAWLAFWGACHLLDNAIDRDLQARSGLSHGDYLILAMLSAAPAHRLRMSTLAEVVFVSRSRLTYQVTQLEKAGLVRREDCPSDKRGAVAVLTPEGYGLLRAAAPGHVACVRRVFFDVLTPEQVAVLGDALTSIVERLLEDPERRIVAEMWAAAS
jgi:DNA-binding MarR family transcriptional regulator